MGERAFEKEAGEDDLRAMERELRDAIRAGAIGFTTSRSPSHETPDGRLVASRLARWGAGRGDLRAGRRGDRADQRRPARAPGVPRPAARPRGRDRTPGHVRPLQPEA